MPRVGGRYLLFLTHDFETPNDTGKDFYLLTGYELRDGQVRLLDDTRPGHPITRYDGATETTLLNDLFNTVAKTSSPLTKAGHNEISELFQLRNSHSPTFYCGFVA